jgi:hypothetical protein
MTLGRHGRACPGHPETQCKDNRDARDKRGHDAVVFLALQWKAAQ